VFQHAKNRLKTRHASPQISPQVYSRRWKHRVWPVFDRVRRTPSIYRKLQWRDIVPPSLHVHGRSGLTSPPLAGWLDPVELLVHCWSANSLTDRRTGGRASQHLKTSRVERSVMLESVLSCFNWPPCIVFACLFRLRNNFTCTCLLIYLTCDIAT